MATDEIPPARDWSRLPLELLVRISAKLPFVADYARFRAAAKPIRLPPQLPWLTLPRKPNDARYPSYGGEDCGHEFGWMGDSDRRHFFSLSDRRNYLIYLPEARRMRFYGAGHGWLLVTGAPEIFLLNPLTRAHVVLPSVLDFPIFIAFISMPSGRGYTYCVNDLERGTITHRKMRNSFLHQAVVSSNPGVAARVGVMVSLEDHRKLGFCWVGDSSWTMIDAGFSGDSALLSYFEGKFYAVHTRVGKVVAIDVRASPVKIATLPWLPAGQTYALYYLVASAGRLLLVGRYQEREFDQRMNVTGFEDVYHVYEMIVSGKKVKWSRINDIGDQVLFLSPNNSLSVKASDFPGFCKPNRIYFADYFDPTVRHYDGSEGHAVGVFNIKDGGLDLAPTYHDGLCMWHKASWVLPSLC